MSDLLKPYPKYKDSGIPWLGKIPDHWDVRRNGRLFAQRNETGFGELPILEVSLRTGVRVRDMDNLKRKQVMSDAEKYKRAKKGDIAYNMMRMWQGALGTAPVDGLVSPAYVVARPFEETNPYYYSYLFRTEAYKAEVDGYSRGIVKDRNRLYWQDFKRMPSCFPPPDEQAGIVRFLDANAVLVRQFIRNRRRLIEVLTEQKQAIINRAVTRGLDRNAKMKPSGVDWLGNVPERWQMKRIKHVFKEVDRRNSSGEGILLTLSRYKGLLPQSEHTSRPPSASDFSKYKICRPNELVMNRMQAWSGMFATAKEEGIISPDYCVFAPLGDAFVTYFELVFKTPIYITQFAIRSKGIGSGFNRLYTPDFGAIPVAMPPAQQQEHLVSEIKTEAKELDQAIQHSLKEIESIQLYRDRLILDITFGVVDVRNAQTDLSHLGPMQSSDDDESSDLEADLETLDEDVTHADD